MIKNGKNPDDESLPPNDFGAEQGCLACILSASDEAARQWLDELSLDCFYDLRHQEIYRALTCLNGSEINVVSLYQWLSDKNRMEGAGGAEYVQSLPERTPSPSMWPSYFAPLESCRLRRAVLRDSTELSIIAKDRSLDTMLISDAARRIAASYSVGAQTKFFTMRYPDELLAMQFDDADRILGDRLLAKGQSLVIAGAGSLGKSRLALQMVACATTGKPFIGFETRGEELRWLFFQAENSNRRLQADLSNIRDWLTPSEWVKFNRQLVIHTLETDADNFLSIDSEKTQERLSASIAFAEPDIVIYDSLYNFGAGNLNTDEDMIATLLALSRITKAGNPDRSMVILTHAITGKIGAAKATGYDRASFARNSKALHQWTRGQMNVAPGSGDDPSLLVISCGKCSNGQEFKPFAIRLEPISMVYSVEPDFDMDAWQAELAGKSAPITSEDVAALCFPPMVRSDLSRKCMEEFGCTRESSYRLIRRAEKQNAIVKNIQTERFSRP